MQQRSGIEARRKFEPYLGGIALLLLLVGCVAVLRPFLTALTWAVILAYSLHPLQRRFTRWFRGSRTLAACLVTLTMTLLLAGPIILIGASMVEDAKSLATATRKWYLSAPETAPSWISGVPVVGDEMEEYWTDFANGRKRWLEQLDQATGQNQEEGEAPPQREPRRDGSSPQGEIQLPGVAEGLENGEPRQDFSRWATLLGRTIAWARTWLISAGLALGHGVTEVLLSAFLAFFFLRDAPILSERLSAVSYRLAGDHGRHLLKVAGDTVRGVVYGVLGTALAQAVMAGIGFGISGVPGAVLLAVLTFFVAVIPFGPPLIWIPATIWLFTQHDYGWGIFLLLWGTFGISSVDNILRPLLISQGSKMPFVLIFCGLIGGAITFGLVGLFLGPTLLAVVYRLVQEWLGKPLPQQESSELHPREG